MLDYFNGDQLAADVWKSKYAIEGEETPDDMHKRLAKAFATKVDSIIEQANKCNKHNLSDYGQQFFKSITKSEDLIYNLFKDFRYVVPQGSIMSTLGTNKLSSLSNCFYNGTMEDNIESIFDTVTSMAEIGKRRGGTATDLSKLRPSGAEVHNSAKYSSGAVEFLNLIDSVGKTIGQEGRRMAIMVSMDIRHPDVLEFINVKQDLSKITNANLSVKIDSEFRSAVNADTDYLHRFPIDLDVSNIDIQSLAYNQLIKVGDNCYVKKVKAKNLWDTIIKAAWKSAEPGILYWDNVLEYGTDSVYPEHKPEGVNPCAEITLSKLDSCRLIALNLFGFVKNPFTEQAQFDFTKFYQTVYQSILLSDALVDLEIDAVDSIMNYIKNKSGITKEYLLWEEVKRVGQQGRRTGLGFTGLGDTIAANGFTYCSEKSKQLINRIMRVKMEAELEALIDLACILGTFPTYNKLLEYPNNNGANKFYEFIRNSFPKQWARMQLFGRRSVSWSTLSPTGTVSLMTQTTSGIEPLFQPYYIRRKVAKDKVDFVDDNGNKWEEFFVIHDKLKMWININKPDINIDSLTEEELKDLYQQSPYANSCANDLYWGDRIEIQSLIQSYTTHSISSTLNLPEDVSLEEVSNIYTTAGELNLKGVTIYRNNSRAGVLVTKPQTNSIRRPKVLRAEITTSVLEGKSYSIIIGFMDNKPFEVFIDTENNFKNQVGELIKEGRGVYSFKDSSGKVTMLNKNVTDAQATVTRIISASLRTSSDYTFIIEQLFKCDDKFHSFTKVVARVLKKYLKKGTKSNSPCSECGMESLVFENGCFICKNCGHSKCN